ncbi:asparagine synthetase domain-containing protein 1-like [Ylistrum balloti]|uniref:asparagine synthetase domain-containing protein 1-like n=1 Tax=Ylistrum balloti TaxID=509963 RepID=UPI002905A430|nr:asparagine synthetase domain-containing protein 1-like [Ylistrum balloti]
MCGICCVCSNVQDDQTVDWKDFIEKHSRIGRRGPDCSRSTQVESGCKGRQLFLQGHVLHLRGELTPQPLQDHHGNTLLWNGEIFGGLEIGEEENDTEVLLRELSASADPCNLLTTMAKVQGPWAFMYWEEKTKCLWFGRDMFGRRSLLWHLPQNRKEPFILSSTQIGDKEFQEIPSVGIYCLHFSDIQSEGCDLNIHLYPREESVWPGTLDKVDNSQIFKDRLGSGRSENSPLKFSMDTDLKFPSPMPKLNKALLNTDSDLEKKVSDDLDHKVSGSNAELIDDHQKYIENLIHSNEVIGKLADQLIDVLQRAVKKRIYNQPGLSLMTDVQNSADCLPDVKRSPCSQCKPHPVFSNKTNESGKNPSTDEDTSTESISSRGEEECVAETKTSVTCEQENAKVAILFSGGIDSAVITALADRCLPESEPIDLMNVAFEQQMKPSRKKGASNMNDPVADEQRWNVPDRLTGYSALAELNPRRRWNFIQVNVSLPELQQIRSNHVRHLVYPLDTVLDDSIGCAVWFAARGQGIIGNGAQQGFPYTSTARVILCGMGADEQLAGYSRHRGRFSEQGWQGLLDEVELEITRISARNLGRDDRIITDHGKESRFPFLDEEVVKFLSSVPMHYKANLDLPRGIGEKLLLRVCAAKLGLLSTSVLPKRAIQFGSRIAKMENNKEKATDKCKRLAD